MSKLLRSNADEKNKVVNANSDLVNDKNNKFMLLRYLIENLQVVYAPIEFRRVVSVSAATERDYNNIDYQRWFNRHVVHNYLFMSLVFIYHDKKAIDLFRIIINSDEFLSHVVLMQDKYKELRALTRINDPNFLFPKVSGNEISNDLLCAENLAMVHEELYDDFLYHSDDYIIPDKVKINFDYYLFWL